MARALPGVVSVTSGSDVSLLTEDEEEATVSEDVGDIIELSSSGSGEEEYISMKESQAPSTDSHLSTKTLDLPLDSEESETTSQAPSTDSYPSSKTEESTLDLSRDFNDTLEKVEYLMKKGEKVLKNKLYEPPTPPQVLTPSSSSSSGAVPKVFKQPAMPSKIPQMRAKKWDYVKSPISAYINKTPTVPLFSTNKGLQEKLEAAARSPRSQAIGEVREKENVAENTPPRGRTFPKKACISAPYAVVHDERTTPKFPGGVKMQKLLGSQADPDKAAVVTARLERYKTQRLPPEVVEQERRKMTLTEDSIADLSLISGDVSVHVLKNAMNF